MREEKVKMQEKSNTILTSPLIIIQYEIDFSDLFPHFRGLGQDVSMCTQEHCSWSRLWRKQIWSSCKQHPPHHNTSLANATQEGCWQLLSLICRLTQSLCPLCNGAMAIRERTVWWIFINREELRGTSIFLIDCNLHPNHLVAGLLNLRAIEQSLGARFEFCCSHCKILQQSFRKKPSVTTLTE